MTVPDDVEAVWKDFWEDFLVVDGIVDLDAVKRELYDYRVCLQEVSKAYYHITSGRLSKPNTAASYIIESHDKALAEEYREGYEEGRRKGPYTR